MSKATSAFLSGSGGLLICLLLISPSFVVNNGSSHDWGGDFALYIRQAQNIIHGVPQADNGYIYNSACPVLSPPTYPIGFPLILAPLVAVFGNDMAALIDYMAIIFIAFGLCVFILIRSDLGFWAGLIAAVSLVYHPDLLSFKREVMSDIPFALLMIAGLYSAVKEKWILFGLLISLSISTRTIGASVLLATALFLFIALIKKRESLLSRWVLDRRAWAIGIGVIGYWLLNHLMFETTSESGYLVLFDHRSLGETISENLEFYWTFLLYFLFDDEGTLASVGLCVALVLLLIGWLKKSRSDLGLMELWLPIYLIILLIYPYRGAGLRFMLPVLPMLFLYAGIAIGKDALWQKVLMAAILLVPLSVNVSDSLDFTKNWPQDVSGPQSETSKEMFEFVRSNIPENESILFLKPRVLALYTGRSSMSNERFQEASSIKTQLDTIPIQHVLRCHEIWNPGLDSLISNYSDHLELEFENSNFQLYRYAK